MTVRVTFQGPDWNPERSFKQLRFFNGEVGVADDEVTLIFEAFDIDYATLTIYDDNSGNNLMLAERADLMNECGKECGPIGWVIRPEAMLLKMRPDLAEHVGKRYGRVIVSSHDDLYERNA